MFENPYAWTAWLPTIIAGGAVALLWNDIRNFKNDLRRSLFGPDGESVYIPRVFCDRERTRCQIITCGKIDGLYSKLDDMNQKRESAKEISVAQLGDIEQELALLNKQVEQLVEKGK